MRTAVRILRGNCRGREGWITGTLADRQGKGIGKALVHLEGDEPEFYALSSLEEAQQLGLFETPSQETRNVRLSRST